MKIQGLSQPVTCASCCTEQGSNGAATTIAVPFPCNKRHAVAGLVAPVFSSQTSRGSSWMRRPLSCSMRWPLPATNRLLSLKVVLGIGARNYPLLSNDTLQQRYCVWTEQILATLSVVLSVKLLFASPQDDPVYVFSGAFDRGCFECRRAVQLSKYFCMRSFHTHTHTLLPPFR